MSVQLGALASREEFMDFLELTESNLTAQQVRMADLCVDMATEVIQKRTGRTFRYYPGDGDSTQAIGVYTPETTPDESIYDGRGRDVLQLRQYPIVDIGTITTETNVVSGILSEDTVSADDYRVLNESGGVALVQSALLRNIWPRGRQNVRVWYKAGFPEIPDDLKYACLEIAKTIWMDRKRNSNVTKEQLGSAAFWYSATKKTDPVAVEIIDLYGRISLF